MDLRTWKTLWITGDLTCLHTYKRGLYLWKDLGGTYPMSIQGNSCHAHHSYIGT